MSINKTPLRYPGGKQRLWPFVKEILLTNGLKEGHYVEPYAGGAGVAIELLLRGCVSTIHLNDSCIGVYSFWHSILNETERFCSKVARASLTVDEWLKQREVFKDRARADRFDVGFATFYLNRCNRSGILTGGVIGGLSQSGHWKIDARFPRNELIKRIEAIAAKKSSIRIKNWDAERFLDSYVSKLPKTTLIYCDPPYFHKADRLYHDHYRIEDHARIAQVIQRRIKRHWIVSYDSALQIMEHYEKRRSFLYALQYNAARAYKGTEAFFFSDSLKLPKSSSVPYIDAALRALVA